MRKTPRSNAAVAVRGRLASAAAAVSAKMPWTSGEPDAIEILEKDHRRLEDLQHRLGVLVAQHRDDDSDERAVWLLLAALPIVANAQGQPLRGRGARARAACGLRGPGGCRRHGSSRWLAECDAVSICVPTPLSKIKDPDLSFVLSAGQAVAAALRPTGVSLAIDAGMTGDRGELFANSAVAAFAFLHSAKFHGKRKSLVHFRFVRPNCTSSQSMQSS